jgi:hypothetical protein
MSQQAAANKQFRADQAELAGLRSQQEALESAHVSRLDQLAKIFSNQGKIHELDMQESQKGLDHALSDLENSRIAQEREFEELEEKIVETTDALSAAHAEHAALQKQRLQLSQMQLEGSRAAAVDARESTRRRLETLRAQTLEHVCEKSAAWCASVLEKQEHVVALGGEDSEYLRAREISVRQCGFQSVISFCKDQMQRRQTMAQEHEGRLEKYRAHLEELTLKLELSTGTSQSPSGNWVVESETQGDGEGVHNNNNNNSNPKDQTHTTGLVTPVKSVRNCRRQEERENNNS